MKYINFFLGIFILSFIGCKSEHIYNDVVVLEDRIIALNDTLSIEKQKMYDGKYSLDIDGKLYKKGNFIEAFPKGEWLYVLSKEKKLRLKWQVYNDDARKIKLSYLESWKAIEDLTYPKLFAFYFGSDKSVKTTKSDYFIVSTYELEKGKTLEGFNNYFDGTVKEDYSANSDNFNIIIEQDTMYYNRYAFEDTEGVYSIYNLNTRLKNQVIEVSMKVSNDLFVDNQVIFFELCRSLDIENQKVMPRMGHLTIEKNTSLVN